MELKKATKASRSTLSVSCTSCEFSDTFAPDHEGATYFQTYGECPLCGASTVYADGKPTKIQPRDPVTVRLILIVAGLSIIIAYALVVIWKTIISFL